jgi:hypothetical protein
MRHHRAGDKQRPRQTALVGEFLTSPEWATLAVMEGDLHIFSVGGMLGDYPPVDPAGFEAFTASVCFPDVAEALQGADPVGHPVAFRFPASVRYRYERLRRFPAGRLVIGGAVCSFNPIYGQGVTVAAIEATILQDLLRTGSPPAAGTYFRRITKMIDIPWGIAVGADLALPGVAGRRSTQVRLVNTYLPRLHAAASTDDSLAEALIRVMGMLDRPESLAAPGPGTAGAVGTPARRTRADGGTAPRPAAPISLPSGPRSPRPASRAREVPSTRNQDECHGRGHSCITRSAQRPAPPAHPEAIRDGSQTYQHPGIVQWSVFCEKPPEAVGQFRGYYWGLSPACSVLARTTVVGADRSSPIGKPIVKVPDNRRT